MIKDVTGIQLIPGMCGRDCPGNGNGLSAECCCDECDYWMCCTKEQDERECAFCMDNNCPRANGW